METFLKYQNIIEKALNRNEIHKNLNESVRFWTRQRQLL